MLGSVMFTQGEKRRHLYEALCALLASSDPWFLGSDAPCLPLCSCLFLAQCLLRKSWQGAGIGCFCCEVGVGIAELGTQFVQIEPFVPNAQEEVQVSEEVLEFSQGDLSSGNTPLWKQGTDSQAAPWQTLSSQLKKKKNHCLLSNPVIPTRYLVSLKLEMTPPGKLPSGVLMASGPCLGPHCTPHFPP